MKFRLILTIALLFALQTVAAAQDKEDDKKKDERKTHTVKVGFFEVVEVKGAAPGAFDGGDFGAAALCDVGHACAEDAVDSDECVVAGFEEVGHACFHAG